MTGRRRLLVALVLVILAGAACSNPPAETGAGGGATTAAQGTAMRFAECMRDNGVRAFPDPDASGDLTIDAVVNGSALDASSPAFEHAMEACKDLQPPGFTGGERTPRQQEAALQFARCIRENGVADFPDPTPDSPLVDTGRIPSLAGKDPRRSPLTAAMERCGDKAAAAGVTGP